MKPALVLLACVCALGIYSEFGWIPIPLSILEACSRTPRSRGILLGTLLGSVGFKLVRRLYLDS